VKSDFRRGGPTRPLTRGLHILLLFIGLLFVAACSRSASHRPLIVTDKEVSPQPVHVGNTTVSFRLSDAGKPVSDAHVTLEGDMTHAGMAPVFGDAQEDSSGHYQGHLNLNMGGDWVVLIHVALPDGHNMEEQMDLKGVKSK